MRRALADPERGLGKSGVEADDEALAELAQLASGDARKALNLLELAAADAEGGRIDAETVRRVAQRKVLLYDKSGEEHYNLISALHKSLRESDPDAAIYWFARMLASGEDPLYVARRMIRFASEDVGLADPQALPQTLAAATPSAGSARRRGSWRWRRRSSTSRSPPRASPSTTATRPPAAPSRSARPIRCRWRSATPPPV